MDRRSAEFLALAGVNADGFETRQLNEAMLAEVDFVLALTVEHRNMVLAWSPRMLKRAFTGNGQQWWCVDQDDGGFRQFAE